VIRNPLAKEAIHQARQVLRLLDVPPGDYRRMARALLRSEGETLAEACELAAAMVCKLVEPVPNLEAREAEAAALKALNDAASVSSALVDALNEAARTRASIEGGGWEVESPAPERLAAFYAIGALLAARSPEPAAAVECTALVNAAMSILSRADMQRRQRDAEASKRSLNAKAAASVPRPNAKLYAPEDLAEAYRRAKDLLGGDRRTIVNETHRQLEKLLGNKPCPQVGQVGRALKKAAQSLEICASGAKAANEHGQSQHLRPCSPERPKCRLTQSQHARRVPSSSRSTRSRSTAPC
jgi:hypothetical protein